MCRFISLMLVVVLVAVPACQKTEAPDTAPKPATTLVENDVASTSAKKAKPEMPLVELTNDGIYHVRRLAPETFESCIDDLKKHNAKRIELYAFTSSSAFEADSETVSTPGLLKDLCYRCPELTAIRLKGSHLSIHARYAKHNVFSTESMR